MNADRIFMASVISFKHPFTCNIGGPTGSGKSTFYIPFLQNLDTLCTEPNFQGGIIRCYIEQSAARKQLLAALRAKVQVQEGENFGNAQGKPCPFILHDLLN